MGRFRQGILALRPKPEPDEHAITHRWLSARQRAAFEQLPTHDRAHLIRVGRQLIEEPAATDDLVIAGLLHDIGKVSDRHQVRLIDRTLKVLLERVSPRALLRLASRESSLPFCNGLVLAVHHAEIGSERARQLGCTEHTCWLIKNHDNPAIADPDLQRLIDIDRTTP